MEDMQKMEKDQNSVLKQILKSCKVQSVEEVTHAALMKPSCCSKDTLAGFVEKLLKLSISNLESCRTAAVKIRKNCGSENCDRSSARAAPSSTGCS